MRRILLCGGLAVLTAVLAACGSARRGEPLTGPLPVASPEVRNGRIAFMANCHQCHPQGEAGLGPALNNKPLPGFLVKLQVREGFGAMPAFSPAEIDPGALDDIVDYLLALRRSG